MKIKPMKHSKSWLYAILAMVFFSAKAQTSAPSELGPHVRHARSATKDEKFDFETAFMPGLAYTVYAPAAHDSIGNYSGICIDYLFYAQVHQNDDYGPSHIRFYGKISILKSDKGKQTNLLMYNLGLDMSIERNPKRNYLIPFFGAELGGISKKQFTTLAITPTAGIYLLSKKNIFINLYGGYVYTTREFETYKGFMAQAGLNFALW
jgi:hypothetical protein